ncbi:MAG: hypothetical protein JSS50_00765 [Proteobacteria bacterium]|nr:hypothetical protein [Pseudomonadota bacterium]
MQNIDVAQHYKQVESERVRVLVVALRDSINSYHIGLESIFTDKYRHLLLGSDLVPSGLSENHKTAVHTTASKDAKAVYSTIFGKTSEIRPIDKARASYGRALLDISLMHGAVLTTTMLTGYGGLIGIEIYVIQEFLEPAIANSNVIRTIDQLITQGITDGSVTRWEEYLLRQQMHELSLANGSYALDFAGFTMLVLAGAAFFWMLGGPIGGLRDYADKQALNHYAQVLASTTLAQEGFRQYPVEPGAKQNIDWNKPKELGNRDFARVLLAIKQQVKEPEAQAIKEF